VENITQPSFQSRCVASGLITPAELADALRGLKAKPGTGQESAEPTDERLALRLVELGRLNRWQAQQLLAGRARFSLGPYRMIDSIGQGGMGQIFKAEHTVMGRIVAVKVLPRDRSSPEAITSFHREIRAQAQLDHENLVRALDAGHDGNVHYLVTEYVPGVDLRRLVRRQGRLEMGAAASIVAQAAQGLSHGHAIGLIHRDVKPGNILVTPDGRAKVSDLGLADFFDVTMVAASGRRGRIVGTADYLSPEQISSPENLTPASDIYALGCTLYYAVTGKVPFPGGGTREKIYAHLNLHPIDPRRFNPDLSDDFVEVIADMMAKKPAERIQTGEEVVARLTPWLTGGRASLRPGGPGHWVPPAVSDSSPAIGPPLEIEDAEMPETVPSFDFLQPASEPDESKPAHSQNTITILSAEEETRPSFESREILARVKAASGRTIAKATETTGISAWLLFAIIGAAAISVGCIVAMVMILR
jgi:serine/threonine protein kinase